jgi:hypothetical protein
MCSISKCAKKKKKEKRKKKAKRAIFLSLEIILESNLTNQELYTKTSENLTCKSWNVVYGIECILCGLIYVGETKGSMKKNACQVIGLKLITEVSNCFINILITPTIPSDP